MFTFKNRSREPEILDNFDLKGNDLTENLRELERVNKLLGGYAIVKYGLKKLLPSGKAQKVTIIDAGCGGGDTLREILKWSISKPWDLSLIGIDANQQGISYCKLHSPSEIDFKNINILSEEFKALHADVVMFNLFLHHFTEDQIIEFVKHAKSAGSSILINDLQRSKIAYHLFRLASRIFKFSYISRHDGKLSVKKSFTKEDWRRILQKAGITNYSIQWKWAFRYLVLIPSRNT